MWEEGERCRASVLLGFCLGEQAKGLARCLQHLCTGVSPGCSPFTTPSSSASAAPSCCPPPFQAVLLQSPRMGCSVAAVLLGAQPFSPCWP